MRPDGVDIFFDNAGGEALDTVMSQLREQARLVLCGAISQYESAVQPLHNSWELITKRARMEGFMFSDYFECFPRIADDLLTFAGGRIGRFDAVYEGMNKRRGRLRHDAWCFPWEVPRKTGLNHANTIESGARSAAE